MTKPRLMTVPQGETKPTGPDFYAPPGRKDVTSAAPPSDGLDDAAVRAIDAAAAAARDAQQVTVAPPSVMASEHLEKYVDSYFDPTIAAFKGLQE